MPGLIVQAKTSDNKFSYELVNIEKSEKNNIEIKKPIMGRKTSLLDLEKETEKINDEHNRKVMLEYAQRGLNIKVSSKTDYGGRKELNYDDLK